MKTTETQQIFSVTLANISSIGFTLEECLFKSLNAKVQPKESTEP